MKDMSKTMIALVMTLIVLLTSNLAVLAENNAGEHTVDLPSMSIEAILSLRTALDEELYNRGEAVALEAGEYLVGRDIAAGSYTLTPYNGNKEDRGTSWSATIYQNANAKAGLSTAERAYWVAKNSAEKAIFPEEVNESAYIAHHDYYRNYESTRITLEEGQVLEVKYSVYDEMVEVVISKSATGLFMD